MEQSLFLFLIIFSFSSDRYAPTSFLCRPVELCSEECVRLKNSVKNSEITDNEIEHCGVQDFVNDYEQNKVNDEDRNVNGEGIYIGTSMSQV